MSGEIRNFFRVVVISDFVVNIFKLEMCFSFFFLFPSISFNLISFSMTKQVLIMTE